MDYENYVKGKYMKMALKGIKMPFSEKWESALVAIQCLFVLVSNMQTQAAKLVDLASEEFNEAFSNGKPQPLNKDTEKYLANYLRAQNYMRASSFYIPQIILRLNPIIIEAKEKIDDGIFKYYIGNKAVLKGYFDEISKQITAIDDSTASAFPNEREEIEAIKNRLAETFNKTSDDIQDITSKFLTTLNLVEMIR